MSPTKFKIEKRAITPKSGIAELWLLCNALLHNDIYIPTKFLVDISCSFRVIVLDKVQSVKMAIIPKLGKA
jgi:hypothetical protein